MQSVSLGAMSPLITKNISSRNKIRLNSSKLHQNGSFDFLTACHEIKIDEL